MNMAVVTKALAKIDKISGCTGGPAKLVEEFKVIARLALAQVADSMAGRFVKLYAGWMQYEDARYERNRGGEQEPPKDLWDFIRERDAGIVTTACLYDALPRAHTQREEEINHNCQRLVDVVLFEDGSSVLRRYELGAQYKHGEWVVS